MRLLLLTPPMTQLNTPYPATAYLTGFLRSRGYTDVRQADPALALVLRLFSEAGLREIAAALGQSKPLPAGVRRFLGQKDAYFRTVDGVIAFLQGRDPSMAQRICRDGFLPQGARFKSIGQLDAMYGDGLGWAFGALGTQDRAKYLASLYVDDLADVIKEGIDRRFELSRYGEKLAASAPSFEPMLTALKGKPSLVDRYLDDLTRELMHEHQPDVVGLTVPFPGNVYGALRMAQVIKRERPATTVVMGGGYVNTELRELSDPRIFDFVDYLTLDDGEKPLLCLLEHLAGQRPRSGLLRTVLREDQKVVLVSDPSEHDIPFRDCGTPSYEGLALNRYLSLCEMLNPMHRIWSDGRWNKLTLAHGCYWKSCSFCDTSLDYINRYEDQAAEALITKIERMKIESGQSGFHFVDEAAPPKVLFAMSRKLLERQTSISWWGNVRFEKTFTPPMAKLMADAGCIAVSGGLEVASDRLLALMNKGVTVEQVARVTRAFTDAGIMVHAYLMYGFPTQTVQETIDALERVRQLFAEGCIHSAYWHRFTATVHSPVGRHPERYGIKIIPPPASTFARNDLEIDDPTGVDHDMFSQGLHKAIYNFMHGIGLEEDVRFWFDFEVPKARVPKNLVAAALRAGAKLKSQNLKPSG